MGVLGMGFVATYLPEAATSAYLAAVALHIIVAQMTCIFGIMVSFHAGPIAFIYVSNLEPPSEFTYSSGLQRKVGPSGHTSSCPRRNSVSYKLRSTAEAGWSTC